MDSSSNGFVTHAEFCDACRRINYRGNVRDAWHELDADGMGKATLCELDWATAEALGRFCTTLAQTFGAVDKAARLLGLKGNRRLRREDFRSLMTEHNLLSSREADGIFRMMCSHDTMARPSVREKEFQWLVQLSPSLPRPGRVAPGGQELELPGELPSDPSFAEPEVRTPRNRSQPLRRQEAGDDEALYDRLWQEAQEFHKKKQEKHAKEGLYRHPRDMTPTSNPRCGNQAHCEKLYKDSKSKMQKQERVEAEERKYYYDLCRKRHKRTTRDEEVWARLVQTKPREEKEEEKGDSQTELPEGTKTKAEKAAERLWAKAVKTQREKKEQAAKEKPDISIFEKECARRERQRSKEEPKDELQQKKLVAARAKDYVQRLQEDLQRKQQENRLKKQELERQAEENKKPRQPKAVKARPETFYRLHLDGMQREEALAERRRIKEMEEEYQLKARSIHSRSAHNPQVFSRLYSKTPREAQLDAEESAYSGSELYEDATRLDASSFLARAKPGSASPEPREDESNGEEPADETTPASQEHRRSSEEDLQQTLQELREARRSRLAMKDWMETQRQELQATASSRSRVAPGDRTEVPPESGKPDLASASAELQALLQRRPGSGSKRRSMAATKLSQELFGDESPSSPGSPGSPAREPPLPSHSSHSELWGAMAGMVSWNEEQP
ncbi:unnamed protein product [Effrenium voratum]|uniref:EF-hand domain-containing protein n=1 Tax=Effrenium voratum TaxID=2562239 RepID=A0AA36NEP0_9DINO|nr:unnamed protein product [Effrenium voratum]